MRRYLITGITGSLGRALTRRFLSKEKPETEIIGIARDPIRLAQLPLTFPPALRPHLRIFSCDIAYQNELLQQIASNQPIDCLIHTAALKHVGMGETDQASYLAVNVQGTQHVAELVKRFHIPVALFVSTDKAVDPINFYGMTKALSERLWPGWIIRMGNLMDARGGVIARWLRGEPIVLFGRPTRFVFYVDEAAALIDDLCSWGMDNLERPHRQVFVPADLPAVAMWEIAMSFGREVSEVELPPYEKAHEILVGRYERTGRRHGPLIEVLPSSTEQPLEAAFSSQTARRLTAREVIDGVQNHSRDWHQF